MLLVKYNHVSFSWSFHCYRESRAILEDTFLPKKTTAIPYPAAFSSEAGPDFLQMCAHRTGETSHLIFYVQGSYCLGYSPSSLWTFLSTALTHFLEDTLFKDRFALAQFCKPPNN